MGKMSLPMTEAVWSSCLSSAGSPKGGDVVAHGASHLGVQRVIGRNPLVIGSREEHAAQVRACLGEKWPYSLLAAKIHRTLQQIVEMTDGAPNPMTAEPRARTASSQFFRGLPRRQ